MPTKAFIWFLEAQNDNYCELDTVLTFLTHASLWHNRLNKSTLYTHKHAHTHKHTMQLSDVAVLVCHYQLQHRCVNALPALAFQPKPLVNTRTRLLSKYGNVELCVFSRTKGKPTETQQWTQLNRYLHAQTGSAFSFCLLPVIFLFYSVYKHPEHRYVLVTKESYFGMTGTLGGKMPCFQDGRVKREDSDFFPALVPPAFERSYFFLFPSFSVILSHAHMLMKLIINCHTIFKNKSHNGFNGPILKWYYMIL